MDTVSARSESADFRGSRSGILLRGAGLSLTYAGRRILDGVDIEVRQGEVVTVVGLNGCGKSTLVRVLLRLVRVDSGAVWHRPGLRVGYTPQRRKLDPIMPMPVAQYLRLGGRYHVRQLRRVLAEVRLEGALDAQMAALSGGEFSRVALARALLRDPDILVLDEPLSSVDFAGQIRLYELIETIRRRRGCGVLMISHDLHLVMSTTDTVICLNHHVCCSGRPRSVVNDPAFVSLFGQRLAASLAVYGHRHSHAHDPAGRVIDRPELATGTPGAAGASGASDSPGRAVPPDAPAAPEPSDALEPSGAPDAPELSGAPVSPGRAATPDAPAALGTASAPEPSDASDSPGRAATPDVPDKLGAPARPGPTGMPPEPPG